MARILITTFGSYGDLHPYIAVALGLQQRGHEPVIATSASYRSKVEAEGLRFHPVRPDLDDFGPFADVARRVYDPKRGAEYLLRELVLPRLADTYDDLAVAVQGADLLVTHALTYAAHLLARSIGLRWVSTILSPMVFMSAYDPPLLPPAPWLKSLHRMSPALYRTVFSALKRFSQRLERADSSVLPQPGPAAAAAGSAVRGAILAARHPGDVLTAAGTAAAGLAFAHSRHRLPAARQRRSGPGNDARTGYLPRGRRSADRVHARVVRGLRCR